MKSETLRGNQLRVLGSFEILNKQKLKLRA